jgi:CelD/BcsL family acetyltransferase involved in cellulose biosynthesis
VKVDLYDHLEAVGPAAWDDLLARSARPSPFLSWIWQFHWAGVFAGDRRLEIRTVVDTSGRLVAILPLYEAEPGVWRILGGVDVSDYLDLIAEAGREEAAWRSLLAARAAAHATWDLHAVPAASYTVTALPRLVAEQGGEITVAVEERCPILALPPSWEAYLATLSGKHRHELTRKLRRMEREARGARAAAVGEQDLVQARLGDFLRLHRSSRVGKAKFMDDRMEAFFREVSAALAARGMVRLWFLDSDAGPMASFITLEWEDTVGLYNSGFDPAQAALSPGLVLLTHVIRDAISRSKRRFDFLRGEERYKYEFGPDPEEVYQVRLA